MIVIGKPIVSHAVTRPQRSRVRCRLLFRLKDSPLSRLVCVEALEFDCRCLSDNPARLHIRKHQVEVYLAPFNLNRGLPSGSPSARRGLRDNLGVLPSGCPEVLLQSLQLG
jgi:hypothetical protein